MDGWMQSRTSHRSGGRVGAGVCRARVAVWLGSMLMGLAVSAAAQQGPAEVIRSRNVAVEKILDAATDPITPATRERLKDVINGFIDFTELSKRSLGKHWEGLAPAERQEFVDVFRTLVRNTSVRKLEVYEADRMDYPPAEVTGTTATVTTIAHKGTKAVTIVYRMHKVGNEWKAYDVVIDGASTARNYRDSFSREIAKTSYRDMYDKLVKRASES